MSKRRGQKKKRGFPNTHKRSNTPRPIRRPAVIKLADVRLTGFAMANALPGENLPVLVRAALTSDKRDFYLFMHGIDVVINENLKRAGVLLSLDTVPGFLLVIHEDASAELHISNIEASIEILAKRNIQAGDAVYVNDIADIRKLKFTSLTLHPSDKVFICFKVGWKFALFFDLAENRDIDVDRMEHDLGTLYRRLRYQALYEGLSDEVTVDNLTKAGWFPFVELLGSDFDRVLKAYQNDFNIKAQQSALVEKFDHARIECVAERWWKNSIVGKHKIVLEAGLRAFERGDYVSCIKNIMTEIEGVLADLHLAETGATAKTKALLEHAVEKGVEKAGGEASLLFPSEFLRYLSDVAYANFDPNDPSKAGASRHTVGHGVADGNTYTPARALQVILTLDQIVFYL